MMISTILLVINFCLYLFDKPLMFGFINFIWIYLLEIVIYFLLAVLWVSILKKVMNKYG